jgi:hypothetical protein
MKARIALILASTLAVGSAVAAEKDLTSVSIDQAVQYQVYGGVTGYESFNPQAVDMRVTFNDDWVFGVARAEAGIDGSVLGFEIVTRATQFTFGYRADTDLYKGDVLTLQAAVTVGAKYTNLYNRVTIAGYGTETSNESEFDFHYDPLLTARLALTDALSVDANIHAYYDFDIKQMVSKQSLGLTYKF